MKDKEMENNPENENTLPVDFVRKIVLEDIKDNKNNGKVHTRFPPEPNGYLHIGHAKAICLDFGVAEENKGLCNLRMDDTNPEKEDVEYIDAIKKDIEWLGFNWEGRFYYASDYFTKMYEYALKLIKSEKAYVCSLSSEETREYRGTLTEAGKDSPYRNRTIEENLELFEKMKKGEFEEGSHVLRAKIDMASPNLNMRDPTIYRIRKVPHHRTGDEWCIYPMYDFAHCLSDSMEGITHSFCTLEFEDHRPLYDWFLNQLDVSCHPRQIEFARLNLSYTIMSKRKLKELVEGNHVSGWDDPRMPTLCGLRRRGYTPAAIKGLCERVGLSKTNSVVDIALLDFLLREELNKTAPRVMAVLNPLKIIIDNYPEGKVEYLDADNNPEDPESGKRQLPFTKEIYIEKEDFMEDPPKKFFRLGPGREVRLKHAFYIKCESIVKDDKTGEIIELHCTYDPATKGGWSSDGRKVKGTSHWVSGSHAIKAEVRLYDRLFKTENPGDVKDGEDFKDYLNPESFSTLNTCLVEPGLKEAVAGNKYQFLRQGYFCVDSVDSSNEKLIFNRIVPLRDSWAKIQKSQSKK